MKKKTLALLLLIATLSLMLTACGKPAQKSTSLDDIYNSGQLVVALSPDFAPMEFIDPSKEGDAQYQGFDINLAKYIASELYVRCGHEIKLVIEPMEFEACQLAVANKSVHMSISGYSWTEERAENYLMSDYYYAGDNEDEQWVIALEEKAATFNSAEDFDGATVIAQNASLQQSLVSSQLPNATMELVTSLDTAILDLTNGKVDAFACAQGQADVFMNQYPQVKKCGFQFAVDESQQANVILMPLGEQELCDVVNEILAKAYEEGVYGEWYESSLEYAKAIGEIE